MIADREIWQCALLIVKQHEDRHCLLRRTVIGVTDPQHCSGNLRAAARSGAGQSVCPPILTALIPPGAPSFSTRSCERRLRRTRPARPHPPRRSAPVPPWAREPDASRVISGRLVSW